MGLALAACAQPPVVQDQFYRLGVAPPQARASGARLGVLEVERLSADGVTASRPIVYSVAGEAHMLQQYNYHFWVEPPPVMLREELADYLRAAGIASRVVTPDVRAGADYVIGGRIKRFERVVGAKPAAVIDLELWLRRVGDNQVLVLKPYRMVSEGGAGSVADSVKAMNRGVADIFARFLADVAAAARGNAPG